MIPLAAAEVEGARLVAGDGSRCIRRVAIDSREVAEGALFVALQGTRADGHAFLRDAASRGAAAVLCEPGRGRGLGEVAVLEAAAPLRALGALARQVRRRSRANVVGVAGSAGKTTTKDVLRALCAAQAPTIATHLNHNNELGVPLTLCRIEPDTEVAICELAMRAEGEIAALAAVAEPDVGVITNIGPEHLEFLGSVAGVARAEAELLLALPAGGVAVVPHDEPLLEPYRRDDLRVLSFGLAAGADVHPVRVEPRAQDVLVELDVAGERAVVATRLRAPHAVANLCAAAAAYAALGLPVERLGEGAAQIALSPLRGDERPRVAGGVVINDAYNANPLSMQAALTALAERAGEARSVAVLGEMAELGADAADWHRRVGEAARAAGIDVLVGIGPLARGYCEGAAGDAHWYATREAAAEGLPGLLRPGDVVLVKASRSAGLERLDAVIA